MSNNKQSITESLLWISGLVIEFFIYIIIWSLIIEKL
jgi:hypothetical protein